MKQILWSCAGLLLALLALLGGFRLFYDFEYHKIRPLCGEWRSTRNDTRLEINHTDDGFWIRIHRYDPRTGRESFEMHPLKYASCIHYTTYGGARVDLFHPPLAPTCCWSFREVFSNAICPTFKTTYHE